MSYTVKQMAELAGVTPRTLRWYDKIGLLSPEERTEAGYRLYGGASVARLQLILLYRALDMPLEEVQRLLDDPHCDRIALLRSQLTALEERRAHIAALTDAVHRALEEAEGGRTMEDQARFEAFKRRTVQDNEARYGREAREKYGDRAVEEGNRIMMSMTEDKHAAWQNIGKELQQGLEAAVLAGLDPAGEEGARLCALHRSWLNTAMGSCTAEMQRALCAMYLEDPRFTANYDHTVQGCAAFLKAAADAHAGE